MTDDSDENLMEQSKENTQRILCADIFRYCEQAFGLPKGAIFRKTKERRIARARHLAIYLSRKLSNRSYLQIAKVAGYKDHTTVIYGVEAAQKLLDDPRIAKIARDAEDYFSARSDSLVSESGKVTDADQ